ncbi:MAG TPA: peptidoglycan DD-metalloendopeptidase family protein [Actinomycetota bacterium]|nr:peptidoglycan DD-metalloendopeptidase family protein [Actinomycetota bacterium]
MVAVLLALAAVGPGGATSSAHTNDDRLEEIQAEIRQKRRQIRAAERKERSALSAVASSESRQEQLAREIRDLAAELAAGRARLSAIKRDLATASKELGRWNDRLALSEAQLFVEEQTLEERAANAYKLGAGGYLELVIGARSLRDLTDRVEFVQDVLLADSAHVHAVTTARDLVAEQRILIAGYRHRLDTQRDAMRREVRKIEKLKAKREALRAEVQAELARQEALVHDIQTTKAEYEKAVAALEAESASVRAAIQGNGSRGSGSIGARLAWPAPGPVTSGFGWRIHPIYGTRRFHAGVDIDSSCGATIVAAAKGTVISAGWRGGYGKATVIDHGNGLSTLYAHQSSFGVSSGESVGRGEPIGSVGTTGWSTGCHLHFEVRVNGEPVDPMAYL